MASLNSNITNFSPNIYSTANITQKSRSGTNVVLNISITTHLRYSSSSLGSGYTISGIVTANGINRTITLKSSSASWSGTTEHTTTSTMSITVPATTTSITIKYQSKVNGNGESGTGNVASTTLNLSRVLATATSATDFSDTTNPTLNFSNPGNFWLYPYISLWDKNSGSQIGTVIRPDGMSSQGASISSPYTWDLTNAQRNQIRDWLGSNNSAEATVGINTMSGSTSLGASSKRVNFTNVLSPPTFTDFVYEDINNNTTTITGDNSKIILGYSTLQITISGNNKAIANKDATMSYYLINGTQYNYADSIVVSFSNWNSETIEVVAVDSRGISTKVTKSLTIATYTPLEKNDALITRTGNINEETTLEYNGKMQKTLPNGNNNTLTTTYQYKKTSDQNYTTGTTSITPTIDSNGNFSFSNYIIGDIATGFDIDNSYNILVTVSDVLSTIQYSLTLNSGIPAMAIKGNNVAIHGGYDDILGGTQIYGDLFLNGETISDIDSYVNDFDGYIRYKNGIQIAWTESSVKTNSMAQWGNLYYQDFSGFQDWLMPFTATYQQYATCNSNQFWIVPSGPSNTAPGAVRILRPTNSTQTLYIKVITIGKWK